MNPTRRSLLRTLLASMAFMRAAAAGAQRTATEASLADEPIAQNFAYLRIATEEAWITREIADEYMRFLAADPGDEPGFVALGARYYSQGANNPLLASMLDVGEGRLADMDALGIDKQLLLLTAPGVQIFDADTAVGLAANSNDQLADAVAAHPERFAGLAAVAPQDPARAATVIERAMGTLGLRSGRSARDGRARAQRRGQEALLSNQRRKAVLSIGAGLAVRDVSPRRRLSNGIRLTPRAVSSPTSHRNAAWRRLRAARSAAAPGSPG